MKVCWTTWVVCGFAALTLVHTEMFTAVIDMKRMLSAEYDVARLLKTYVKKQHDRLTALSRLARNLEQHSLHTMENPEKYLSNPVIAFLMVKRFTLDWESALKIHFNYNETRNFLGKLRKTIGKRFPDSEDLHGAVDALIRLQDLYELTTDQVASGQLYTDIEQPVSMKLADCIDVGRITYNKADFYHTVVWMEHALQQLEREKPNMTESYYNRTQALILDFLSYATFEQGGNTEALRLTEQLLTIDPNHKRAAMNKKRYEDRIKQAQQQQEGSNGVAAFVNKRNVNVSMFYDYYERLCRGEQTHRRSTRSLSCQYRRHKPLFYIQPAREEVLNDDPRIVLYHNAFSDTSIKRIKQMATPRLKRARVVNPNTGEKEIATYRVSKSAWLHDVEDATVRRISALAGAISNLTLDTVEALQVVNYGIGGHYAPHYDHREADAKSIAGIQDGNRIATVICYLTDVEAGGVTAFNLAGARVVPEKGACAIWYNLLKSGDGDISTRHAGCPVLVGSKWVMNKWFHERGQEFSRRCALSPLE